MACVVIGCRSHSSRKENEFISFHGFPAEDEMKEKWVNIISRQNWTCQKHSRICSKHFEDNCFININSKWRRLKPGAVPSLHVESNILPMEVFDNVPAGRCPVLQQRSYRIGVDVPSTSEQINNTLLLQRRINKLEQALRKSKAVSKRRFLKINLLRQRTRRLKKNNDDLNSRLIDLLVKEKNEKENLLKLDRLKKKKIIEKFLRKEQSDQSCQIFFRTKNGILSPLE